MQSLLEGKPDFIFTHELVGMLLQSCEMIKGKLSGYPHLCGKTVPCGKNDDPALFLKKAREHAAGGDDPVSAGYSAPKASFIVAMVEDFKRGRISGKKVAEASDREAARMLMGIKGIGFWSAGQVPIHPSFPRVNLA